MFVFVRHAACELMDTVLVGRKLNVSLTEEGVRQAKTLARRLAKEPDFVIHTSPRERAKQTAALIAAECGAPIEVRPELDEIDVGEWAGRPFSELAEDYRWRLWNSARCLQRAPGGEAMLDVQARIINYLHDLRQTHPERCFVLVSHAEVIRCALLYYLGLSLAAYRHVEVSPAALSTLLISDWGAKLIGMNERAVA